MQLNAENGRTSATVTTEVQLSAKVATMGQGVLQDVSGRLVATFAKNLAAMLEGSDVPAQAEAAAPSSAPSEAATPRTPAAEPTEPRREAPRAEPADALDLGSLGGAVIADRLQDPRRLAGLLAVVAVVSYLLGRRAGGR
jgi:hypothetical protein